MSRQFHQTSLAVGLIAFWCMGIELGMSQEMQYPIAVAAAPDGKIFVADRNLPGIWKIENGKASIHFQGSKKFRTPLNAVRCLFVDSQGVLYAGDSSTREVYRFDNGQPQPLTKGEIGIPMAIAIDKQGRLLVADLERHCVFQIPSNGDKATILTKTQPPRGVAVDSQSRLWVLSNVKDSIVIFGDNLSREVVVSEPVFEFAHQIVLDTSGNAFVSDGYAKTIWKIPAGGKPEKFFSGDPLKNPVGIAMDRDRLLIADPHQRMIYALPLEGSKSVEAILKP
jgi:sugar lactone lactonase YvrE